MSMITTQELKQICLLRNDNQESMAILSWYEEKRQAIIDLIQDLLNATLIPPLQQTIKNLELLKTPTRKLFYDFGSLLNKRTLSEKYPEFLSLKPGKPIPDEIGYYKIDPHYQFLNERLYIQPILDLICQEGYETARITNQGIYFMIFEKDLPESIVEEYRHFFMNQQQILDQIEKGINSLLKAHHAKSFTDIYRIRINGDQFNHVRITYPDEMSNYELNQRRFELTSHYKRLGYKIKFFYDRNLEDQILEEAEKPEPIVLKIFFDLQDVVPKIRDNINHRSNQTTNQQNQQNQNQNQNQNQLNQTKNYSMIKEDSEDSTEEQIRPKLSIPVQPNKVYTFAKNQWMTTQQGDIDSDEFLLLDD